MLVLQACARDPAPIDSQTTIHLEEHLTSARVESPQAPSQVSGQVVWTFSEGLGSWRPLRIPDSPNTTSGDVLSGVYTELDRWDYDDWGAVVVRIRTRQTARGMAVLFDLEGDSLREESLDLLTSPSEIAPMFAEGEDLTYAFPVRRPEHLPAGAPWTRLGLAFSAPQESGIEILSVTAVPAREVLSWASMKSYPRSHGVRGETRGASVRRTLYAHTPARIRYRVVVPEAGRLSFGLGVVRDDVPVTFEVTLEPEGGEPETLLEETCADRGRWSERILDLSRFGGRVGTLSFEATAPREGTIALWAAPTLGGSRRSDRPNVILYVIDAAGADFMSVYGYQRPTTPRLEEIAKRGALFERAYSNSTWTQPSTASFLTSFHASVLGGFDPALSPLPEGVTTIAGHLHASGYVTAAFTSNPNAGRVMGPEHGTDVLHTRYGGSSSPSSIELSEDFRRFRIGTPFEPYWAHFQTTDVHPPYAKDHPFAGRYVPAGERRELEWWESQIRGGSDSTSLFAGYREELARLGIDARDFYGRLRGVYEEAMQHQDDQIGRLFDQLEQDGELERTLFIVASDHGHPAGSFPRFGRGLLDPEPDDREGALFGAFETHIPLVFVWPGRIAPGQRFTEPVSMIDLLPTVLDLAGLPAPMGIQGRSLAPLLLGEEGFEPRPVILDEFRRDPGTGELIGNLEIIDGRWGASLEIGPLPEGADPRFGRHAAPAAARFGAQPFFQDLPRLLLYDLSSDPFAVQNVNARYPQLVEEYRALLEGRWDAHRALAKRFRPREAAPLTPDELRALRSLGYVHQR